MPENTAPLLFDATDEKYYVFAKGRILGPLTAHDVARRIGTGEFGLLHFFWISGLPNWKRLCDEKDFTVLIPKKPTSSLLANLQTRLKKDALSELPPATVKDHYLYFNQAQYGPFSKAELQHLITTKNLPASTFLWMPGWPNWKRLAEAEEFAKVASASAPPSAGSSLSASSTKSLGKKKKATERRSSPRRPLVAKIFLHNEKEVLIAVCRDVSIGGMQVLTDHAPGPVGSIVKLNVSTTETNKVENFVAEGEIVRILEDGRGFSFRFTKITDAARTAIEKYIQSPATL